MNYCQVKMIRNKLNMNKYETPKGKTSSLPLRYAGHTEMPNAKSSTNVSWLQKFVLLLNIQVTIFQIYITKLFR